MTEEKKQETVKAIDALCEAFGIVKPLDILKCSKMLTELYAELEEENAKLKTQIEDMKNVGNCEHVLNCARWESAV